LTISAGAVAALSGNDLFGGEMSEGSTILILGGGFGGIATAWHLRGALSSEHQVVVVSKTRSFQIGATKTWVMLGHASEEKVSRSLDVLNSHGIRLLYTEVDRIDLSKMQAITRDSCLNADYMVIALGAELDMSLIPGLSGAAETFYTREGAIRLRGILKEFKGGRIAIIIPRLPFQCPPGPYEAAMLIDSYLEGRNLIGKSSIDIYTVEKAPMGTAGPEIGKFIIGLLEERGIGFHPQSQIQEVDSSGKTVLLADGIKAPYDLLIAIPPHLAPRAVRESGLAAASGWIPADPVTLELANSPRPGKIYAIGDVASVPLPGRFAPDVSLVLPKAGIFAERQGRVVASRIAAEILGNGRGDNFDGKGFCYIEIGDEKALRSEGSFYEMPHPVMNPRAPDHIQFAEKKAWVESWIATYL
jgi:sulfide:quinone oxidoreductase